MIKGKKTSKYTGVGYYSSNRSKKTWYSKICVNYKVITIGSFFEERDAAMAYDKYVLTKGLNRKTNFKWNKKQN